MSGLGGLYAFKLAYGKSRQPKKYLVSCSTGKPRKLLYLSCTPDSSSRFGLKYSGFFCTSGLALTICTSKGDSPLDPPPEFLPTNLPIPFCFFKAFGN